ncbi:MAG: cell division protein FtsA [Bryobacteraceae bacterium]
MAVHKNRIAAGLDAGSAYTRCVVCIVDDDRVRLLGFGEVSSRGWQKGRIDDQDAISECIRQAVGEAERMAQVSVEGVVVGVGGSNIEGANGRGLYEFGRPRQIEAGDLGYAIEQAIRQQRMGEDRLLLQVLPQDFTVDGRAGFRNPRGVTCARLEANVYLVTVSAHHHQALIAAIHQSHLGVEESIFEPMAGAYASVLGEERARGVVLADIGAHSTDLVIYDGEALLAAVSLPICGDHFTRDVAYGLRISYEDAETMKEEYGCAMLGLTSDSSLIEVPAADGRPARETTRRQLNEILEARAEELCYYIREEVAKVGMDQSLLEGIVLSGGGALLNGMCDMAEHVLNCPARNGLPQGIENLPEGLMSPAWTTAAGLAMYSARLKLHKETRSRATGLMGMVLR